MEELYIIESGVRRRAIKKTCALCNESYLERASRSRPSKFCSPKCRQEASKKRVKAECAECGKEFYITLSKAKHAKSGYNFCTRKCKDLSQRVGSKLDAMLPKHYGTASRSRDVYRRIYKETRFVEKIVCERCGYCEFECGVDIHHRDGNKSNNQKENLVALCSPCHRALHYGYWVLDF